MARKFPDRPYLVVLRNETLHIHGTKEELLPVDDFEPWGWLALWQALLTGGCAIGRLASFNGIEARQLIHGTPSSHGA